MIRGTLPLTGETLAVQWTGRNPDEISEAIGPDCYVDDDGTLRLFTWFGRPDWLPVEPWQWLVRGQAGGWFPMPPLEFAAQFKAAA